VHVIGCCEWGREEDKFLTFKVSHMWVFIVSFTRERLREEKRTMLLM